MSFGKTQGVRGFRHLKLSEIVDVFLPSLAVSSPVCELVKRRGIDVPTLQLDTDQTFRLRRPAFLQTVVSEYEFLDPEERNEARLRIGWGPRLPDSKAFRRIQQYFATRGARIYHGGVAVWLHGPNFSLRFFDPVARSKQGGKEHFEVSLYLKRDDLRKHWNGKFLIAQLTKATKPSNYAHCYFFGRLVPHPTRHERLTVEFGNFEQIVFMVRRKRAQRALAEPILAQFSESYA